MKISDYIGLSFSNLWNRKLRTFLTAFGVTVGIGALVAMVGFGKGMQKNITAGFESLDLFNSLTVFPAGPMAQRLGFDPDDQAAIEDNPKGTGPILDDEAIQKLEKLKGVQSVFPEIRFPALIKFKEAEELRLVQVIPAKITSSKMIKLSHGKPFARDDEDSVILGTSLLRPLKIQDPASVLGQKIEVASIAFDFSRFNPMNIASFLQGRQLPFKKTVYEFTVIGVTSAMNFGGPSPLQSDVLIPPGSARRIEKLPFANIWDVFRAREGRLGYSAVNIRLSSPRDIDPVKREIQDMGFSTFALIDQFNQIRTSFIYMDMILAAVAMIAIFVASLGIINTMVMSILERYAEIGIMKAVGASDRDVQKIFFFESSSIGFMGGVFGLALGWAVSRIINRVINFFLAKQGLPFLEYFSFPLWLCLGAVAFAVMVSLVSGIYPAYRAARVDPVIALRHD
jgi:putative ABC transport system permease protein